MDFRLRPKGAHVNSPGWSGAQPLGHDHIDNSRSPNGATESLAPLGLKSALDQTRSRGSANPPPLATDGRPFGADSLRCHINCAAQAHGSLDGGNLGRRRGEIDRTLSAAVTRSARTLAGASL